MNGLDLFPTKFFETQIDEIDAFNVLNEILRKEKELELFSSVRQTQSTEKYITDYPRSISSPKVELESLNNVFKQIETEFEKYNSSFRVIGYWTAIYYKNGRHGVHNHQNNILDSCNYSGILYLSELGGTKFYSTSPTSFDNEFYSDSKMGKIIMFPSTQPHSASNEADSTNKRVIVSFNCEIRGK